LPGYVTLEETAYMLRGRLRESEQLHRHHGLPLPLEIRHDEFTVDIPEKPDPAHSLRTNAASPPGGR
jgi:5-methylcytosine-specific restriction enzyme subunit McrC